MWQKVENNLKIGTSESGDRRSATSEAVTSNRYSINFHKESASSADEGQYIILAAGNGFNKKITFWVNVDSPEINPTTASGGLPTSPVTPPTSATNSPVNELERGNGSPFDNMFDDVPDNDVFEPQFAHGFSNMTSRRGDQVKLNMVAFGSTRFKLAIYKSGVGGQDDGLLAAAVPSTNSNWLNLTYIIDKVNHKYIFYVFK